MGYLNCGRCGLEIRIRASFLRINNCPRCLARSAIVTPLVLSSARVTHASGWEAQDDEQAAATEHAYIHTAGAGAIPVGRSNARRR